MATSVPPSGQHVSPFMAHGETTREKLLDAAAQLFAEHGVDNVSIAEIVRRSGQRNASAVHYHFGSRSDVLLAVLARHVPDLARLRQELLDRARRSPPDDRMAVVAAIVQPVTELARMGWRQRAYLQIGSELTGALERTTPEIRELMDRTAGPAAWDLFRRRCPEVPGELWEERQRICVNFVGRAAADRARARARGDHLPLGDDAFVENLEQMVLAAMTAPPRRSAPLPSP